MATFTGQLISATYDAILKTIDNDHIGSTAKQITDGLGNVTPLYISTTQIGIGITPTEAFHVSGNVLITGNITVNTDATITGNLSWGSLTDSGESITISKFVDASDGIANNNNDTSIPTSAAIKSYVDGSVTAQDLDFAGNTGTGSVDLDSNIFNVVGTTNEIITSATGQTLQIQLNSSGVILPNGSTATTQSQGDNSTKVATTAYVDSAIEGQDTLAEILANGNQTGGTDIIVDTGDNLALRDASKLRFGNGDDLEIYHNGSHSYIDNGATDLYLRTTGNGIFFKNIAGGGNEHYAKFISNGAVELYYDAVKKFETTSSGVTVTGRISNLTDPSAAQDAATKAYVDSQVGANNELSEVLANGNTTGGTDIAVSLGDNITFADSSKSIYGAGSDLQIYSDGTVGYIKGDDARLVNASGENIFRVNGDVAELYYNDSKKLETTSSGIAVTGNADVSSTVLVGGADSIFAENNIRFKSAGTAYIDHNTVGQSFIFRTSNSSSLDTTALTINSSGNATFSGNIQTTQITATNGLNYLKRNTDASLQLRSENTRSGLFITKPATDTVMGSALVLADESYRLGTANYYHIVMLQNGNTYFNQNVGINTTSPDSKLDVTGGDITVNTTGTGFMNFKYSGSQMGTIGTDGVDLKITANADLQLLPASNVGINTASPNKKLEILSTNSDHLRLAYNSSAYWDLFLNSSDGSLRVLKDNGSLFAFSQSGNLGIGIAPVSGARLTLGTGSVANEILSFASSTGGNAEFRNTSSTGTFTFTNANGSSEKMRITSGGDVQARRPRSNTAGDVALSLQPTDSSIHYGFRIDSSTNSFNLDRVDSAGNLMTINSSGNVGIGGTGIYTPVATLNLDGEGIAIKNDRNGSSNNWSYIRNTGILSGANIEFVTGVGTSLTLNHDKSAKFSSYASFESTGTAYVRFKHSTGGLNYIGSSESLTGGFGDENDMLNYSASGKWGVYTNSAFAMVVDESQNVGIGTTSPENKLHILRSSSDTQSQIMVQNGGSGDAAIKFNVSGQSYVVGIDQDDSSKFKIASSSALGTNDRVTLLSSGNVGIGTITPNAKLSIYKTGFGGDTAGSNGTLDFGVGSTKYWQFRLASTSSGDLAIDKTYANVWTTPVTIQRSSGNVGIGTASPDCKLDIRRTGTTAAQGDTDLLIGDSGAASSTAQVQILGGASGYSNLYFSDTSAYNVGGFIYNHSSNYLATNVNGAERMRIASNGRVGIGTTSPVALLHLKQANGANIRFENSTTSRVFTIGEGVGTNDVFSFRGNSFRSTDTLSVDFMNDRVGVGTISPTAKLDVKGDGADIFLQSNDYKIARIQPRGTGADYDRGLFSLFNASTEAVRIDSSGSSWFNGGLVGIGITNPSYDLHVVATIGTRVLKLGHGAGHARISTDDASKPLDLQINSQNALRVATSKNIGIGTDTPENKLHILRSSSDTQSQIMVQNSGSGDAAIKFNVSGQSYVVGIDQDDSSKFKIASSSALGTNDRVTLLSSGNVGIGTITPTSKLDVRGIISTSGGIRTLTTTTDYSMLSRNSSNTAAYIQQGGAGNILDVRYGSMLAGQGTSAMLVNGAGNVGIGSVSPDTKLNIEGVKNTSIITLGSTTNDSSWTAGDKIGGINFYSFDGSGAGAGIKGSISYIATSSSGGSTAMTFNVAGSSNNIERMRIDASGDVKIEEALGINVNPDNSSSGAALKTQAIGNGHRAAYFLGNSYTDVVQIDFTSFATGLKIKNTLNANSSNNILFQNTNGTVGSITTSGSATAYNTSSDYRLKENVVEMTGALDRVSQLKPSRFNFIADADKTVDGFLAHEVAEVVPEAITGEKDEVDEEGNAIYQGIDQAKLVPLLVGAIQELKAEVEQLKTQINK